MHKIIIQNLERVGVSEWTQREESNVSTSHIPSVERDSGVFEGSYVAKGKRAEQKRKSGFLEGLVSLRAAGDKNLHRPAIRSSSLDANLPRHPSR